MKIVVGISGVKTSGKSTVAGMIKEVVKEANETALAYKLKNTCAKVFGVERKYFDLQELKEKPFNLENPEKGILLTDRMIQNIVNNFKIEETIETIKEKFNHLIGLELTTPRQIAQIVGTEILRTYGLDIHCENVKLKDGVNIISDIRFPNEYNYFLKQDDCMFVPLYVFRKSAEDQIDMATAHSSETSIFKIKDQCIEIDNNGTLDELRESVLAIVDNLIIPYTYENWSED